MPVQGETVATYRATVRRLRAEARATQDPYERAWRQNAIREIQTLLLRGRETQ